MQSLHFRPLASFPKKSTLFCGTFTTKLALGWTDGEPLQIFCGGKSAAEYL
jgi:hypothetical protein